MNNDPIAAAYAAVSLYATRMKPDVVLPLLKSLGDAALIGEFANCFGKQRYSSFQEKAQKAAFDPAQRLTQGYNPNLVPPDDAFTILDLLRVLAEDDGNRLLLEHPEFKYQRISRARIDASENLTAAEQDEIAELTEEMKLTKDVKKVQELAQRIADITSSKQAALKFTANAAPDGYPISSLGFAEERPNVSVLVRKEGTVDLSGRLPVKGTVPDTFPTFIFRNYSIIKDGIVNVGMLPCKLTDATVVKLEKAGCPQAAFNQATAQQGVGVFDMTKIPVINRKMVKGASAKALFELEYDGLKAAAAKKVYDTYKKENFPKKSEGFAFLYGDEAATWLKDQGITDYNGFNPKTTQAESKDVYMGKELKVSIKGLSSLPSVKDVKAGMAKGKLNAGAALMAPYVDEVEAQLKKYGMPALEAWLDQKVKEAVKLRRSLLARLAEIKFSIVVGQIWPFEFASLDENTMTIDVNGLKLDCKLEMNEVEVKL